MATTTQLLNLARKKMLEEGTEIISDDNALLYANFTYQDLQKKLFVNSQIKTATVNFTNGIGTLPTDFGTLYGDCQGVNNIFYPETSIADFPKQDFSYGVVVQGGQIKVYPTSTASLTIFYYPKYADLSTSQDPQIDSYFHECIIYGILFRAFEELQDEQLSKYYEDKYDTMLNKKMSAQSQYDEDNQRGTNLFNFTPLISNNGVSASNNPNYF